MNPVIMFDEEIKWNELPGDPASALLRVLDPEQNKDFWSLLDVRADLSNA